MEVLEFIQSIGHEAPAPVILLCPAKRPRAREATYEPFLAERAIDRLLETYIDPGMKDLTYAGFYADETPPGQIVMEAQTLPFLAERRVVLVRNTERYRTDSGAGAMLRYLASPSETTLLILVASQIDKRTKFYKLCDKAGLVVECPALREGEVAQWVRNEAKTKGKRIAPNAVREIVRRAGTHLGDVNNAINNVAAYVGDAPEINEEHVLAACADVAEEEIWSLTDAIAASRPDTALQALRRLVDLGKHEDELLGTINWLLKSAYAVAIAGSSRPALNPFVAKKVKPLADKLGVNKLRDAFALCTDTHFMIRSTGVDGVLALELLVVKLAAPIRRRQATRP
ncbi:MAG: DNA polymerase III subunit delta [Nitrospiraceae bacterium]|nr:DNA polymerase III subunit delta [Nitrospiraceae bacterium]